MAYVTGPEQWDGRTLTIDKWTKKPKRVVPDGCIFVTVKGAGVGTLFPGVACAIGRDVYAYEPSAELSAKYIEHYLRYNISEVIRHAKGDIPGLSKGHILGHVTAFPPRDEQGRIVARLDELFSDLDAGVAALERAKANLKRYRAVILRAAVHGALTEEWRAAHHDVEPASKLLDRILAKRRRDWEAEQLARFAADGKAPPRHWQSKYAEPASPEANALPELPPGWCWASVKQLAEPGEQPVMTGPFGSMLGREDFVPVGVPLLTIGCLTEPGVTLDKAFFVSDMKAEELARYRVRTGDLLFSRSASVGRVGYVTEAFAGSLINYHLMRLRLCKETVSPDFFVYYVRGSRVVTSFLRHINRGATRDGIDSRSLLGMPVALPPMEEQRMILNEVKERLSVVAAAEAQIVANLKRAARLRRSILKEALAGELVPQDPRDEPATVLVERIRQQRAGQTGASPANSNGQRRRRKPRTTEA
jgi:type I restriction enzyme S subunit